MSMLQNFDPEVVLRPPSHIDTAACSGFESDVLKRVGGPLLVLDFSDVTYIGSSGLRVLLIAAKRMRATGGLVALCGMQENCQKVLEVTGFLPFFVLHPTVEEALTRSPEPAEAPRQAPPDAPCPAPTAAPRPADRGSEQPGR